MNQLTSARTTADEVSAEGAMADGLTAEDRVPTDECAVRAVIAGVYAAWAANDADEFVSDYAEAATATLPGCYLADREAIRANMAVLFADELKGSRAISEVRTVRLLGSDVAVVTSTTAILYAGADEPAPDSRGRDTWVLARTTGPWRVEAFHHSPESAA